MCVHCSTKSYLVHSRVHFLTFALSSNAIHSHHSSLTMNSHVLCHLVCRTKIRMTPTLVFRPSLQIIFKPIHLLWQMWRGHCGVCLQWISQLPQTINTYHLCLCSEWLLSRRGLRCRECRALLSLGSKPSPRLVYLEGIFRKDEQLSKWNLLCSEGCWFRGCEGHCRTRSREPTRLRLHPFLVNSSWNLFSLHVFLIFIKSTLFLSFRFNFYWPHFQKKAIEFWQSYLLFRHRNYF